MHPLCMAVAPARRPTGGPGLGRTEDGDCVNILGHARQRGRGARLRCARSDAADRPHRGQSRPHASRPRPAPCIGYSIAAVVEIRGGARMPSEDPMHPLPFPVAGAAPSMSTVRYGLRVRAIRIPPAHVGAPPAARITYNPDLRPALQPSRCISAAFPCTCSPLLIQTHGHLHDTSPATRERRRGGSGAPR